MCRGELLWVGVRQELLAWIGMRIKDPPGPGWVLQRLCCSGKGKPGMKELVTASWDSAAVSRRVKEEEARD